MLRKEASKGRKQKKTESQFAVFASSAEALAKVDTTNFFKKEITLFPNKKYTLSFKPFILAQGLIVLTLLAILGVMFVPRPSVDQALVIKSAEDFKDPIIAGEKVKHTILVVKSDITTAQPYVKISKQAHNIKITQITKTQADAVKLAKATQGTIAKTTPEKRLALSKRSSQPFLAKIQNAIRLSIADLEEAASDVVENITEPEPAPEIVETAEAQYVDLSEQASEPETQVEQPIEPAASPAGEASLAPEGREPEQISDIADTPVLDTTTPSDQEISLTPGVDGETPGVAEEVIQIDYETPAPEISESETDTGKLVTISAEEELPNEPLTDVLAFTNIPEIYKVGQESKIKIKWQNEDNREVTFHAYDLNNNGKLDYVEWTVPHLSTQIFEIIFISKAFRLDQNKEITEDIYEYVQAQDSVWTTINNGEYVKVTFEQVLNNTKDITIYMKPSQMQLSGGSDDTQMPGGCAQGGCSIEVYPVYKNEDGSQYEGEKLELVADGTNPDFSNIDHNGKYRVLLTNLQTPTDVFNLKIVSNQ